MAIANLPIIDCDIHPSATRENPIDPFVPTDFKEAIRQGMSGQPGAGYVNPFGVQRRDARCDDPYETARDHLDKYGITYGVLQPPGMKVGLIHQLDVGSAMARAWNDWQINTWLATDKRFLGSVCINPNDPDAAVKEIYRVGKHVQMVQINLSGEAQDLYGHRRYFPIWQACQDLNLPVCLHPGYEGSLNSVTPIGRPSTYFEWHTVIPLTFQAHLVSMVLEGAFEKFKNLKLVLCEGGIAWLCHTIWRMDKNFKALRAATPWLKRAPSEYVFEHLRLTTQPLEEPEKPEQILQIFDMIHAERTIMFATDFPHWDFDDPAKVFPKKMSEDLKQRIYYKTAAELYGLRVEAPALPEPLLAAGLPAR